MADWTLKTARTAALALLAAIAACAAPGCLPDDESPSPDGAAATAPGAGTAPEYAAAGSVKETITLGGKPYTLEVARDDRGREKGLGGRTSIPADGGMLFVFDDARIRKFWMRDCTIDLDIVFVDALGYVTAVHTMPAEAPRGPDESLEAYLERLKPYPSISPAQFAIELRSGEAARLGIKPNDKIEHDWKRVKKLAR